jgi:hypothetical protein
LHGAAHLAGVALVAVFSAACGEVAQRDIATRPTPISGVVTDPAGVNRRRHDAVPIQPCTTNVLD